MTYLIADSGSTKTAWRFIKGPQTKTVFTEGLNPYYHTTESITDVLKKNLLPEIRKEAIDKIYFYGAGCDDSKRGKIINEVLNRCFPGAEIEVEHDLLAAARACLLDEPGIACILGTGSNSCLYDGQKIVEHIPSLAFILGDEGSAGYFGKKLINSYFRDELPGELKERLEASHNMSLSYIMKELYNGDQPSRFVASYGAFLGTHRDHPYVEKVLREGFRNFIARIIKKYTDASSNEISFVGAVACAHQDLIRQILHNQGLKCGLFIEKPLERLATYHVS